MNKHLKIFTLALIVTAAFSCQKKLDYSKPADANTFEKDKVAAFKVLTDNEDALWAWDMPSTLTGNPFPGILLQFFKDSTANIYSIFANGISEDLKALRASGTLTPQESAAALSLINTFNGIPDNQLRQILENPANITFKNRTLALLPNYPGFNSQGIYVEETDGAFDMNGPVQLSLTFHNSFLLSLLKEQGALDFDFRVMKAVPDTVILDGYYSNNANKKSTMYKTVVMPDNFIVGSNIIMAINPVKALVSLKVDGTAIPTPAGYRTGLDFFYRSFNQSFNGKVGYGFASNRLGDAVMPTVLKTAKIVTVKSFFNGNPVTAPSGTVLITLTINNNDGSVKDMTLVKD